MASQQSLDLNWNEIVAQLRARWEALTPEDLQALKGNVDRLIGFIQGKTGEARESVERVVSELTAGGAEKFEQASQAAQQFAQQVASETSQRAAEAADAVRHKVREAEGAIRNHPAEAAAICFGAGIVVGVLVGLALRR
jgi:ElaB/YqjD/DUF883 family membrane-anchored ribosome-binding protein